MTIVNKVAPLQPFEIGEVVIETSNGYESGVNQRGLFPDNMISTYNAHHDFLDFGNGVDYGLICDAQSEENDTYTGSKMVTVVHHLKRVGAKFEKIKTYTLDEPLSYSTSCNLELGKVVTVFRSNSSGKPLAKFIGITEEGDFQFSNTFEVDAASVNTSSLRKLTVEKISEGKFLVIFNIARPYAVVGTRIENDLLFGPKYELDNSSAFNALDLVKIGDNRFLLVGQQSSSSNQTKMILINIIGINVSITTPVILSTPICYHLSIEKVNNNRFVISSLGNSYMVALYWVDLDDMASVPLTHIKTEQPKRLDGDRLTSSSLIYLMTNTKGDTILLTSFSKMDGDYSLLAYDSNMDLKIKDWDLLGSYRGPGEAEFTKMIKKLGTEYIILKRERDVSLRVIDPEKIDNELIGVVGVAISEDTYISKGLLKLEGKNFIPGRPVYWDEDGELTHDIMPGYTSTKVSPSKYIEGLPTIYSPFVGYAISNSEVVISEDIRKTFKGGI